MDFIHTQCIYKGKKVKNFKQRKSTTKPYEFWNSIQNQGFEFDPLWVLSERLVYTHTLHQKDWKYWETKLWILWWPGQFGTKRVQILWNQKKIDIFIYKLIKKNIMKGKNINKEIKIITKFD